MRSTCVTFQRECVPRSNSSSPVVSFRFVWLQTRQTKNLEDIPLLIAYKQADGKKIDNRRVLVDVQRG
nr:U1 small nuclear ribonucleoprotein 70 kDa [Ipomoea batatas]